MWIQLVFSNFRLCLHMLKSNHETGNIQMILSSLDSTQLLSIKEIQQIIEQAWKEGSLLRYAYTNKSRKFIDN